MTFDEWWRDAERRGLWTGEFKHDAKMNAKLGWDAARPEGVLTDFATEAARIMREKGSYDCPRPDPRIETEYANAYSLIQRLAMHLPQEQR